MNDWKQNGPVVIGGVGGSGTRVIAAMLRDMGYYIGSDVNDSLDNLWFTLLFKRPRWFFRRLEVPGEVNRGLSLFRKGMLQEERVSWRELLFLFSAVSEMMRYGHDHRASGRGLWAFARLKTLIIRHSRGSAARYAGWGWKEPNTHIYLEQLDRFFPGLKYIHVIRHGLYMAFSNNQAQLYNWGRLWGIDAPLSGPDIPGFSCDYWIQANQEAIRRAADMPGNRFLLLRFDNLQNNPREEIERLVRFLNKGADVHPWIDRLVRHVRRPESSMPGRIDYAKFSQKQLEEVKKLGFEINAD